MDYSGVANLTQVASSATSVPLLAANGLRKGLIITNNSTAILYVACATTASTSAFTVEVAAGTSWVKDDWTGPVSGIWASVNGSADITEFV